MRVSSLAVLGLVLLQGIGSATTALAATDPRPAQPLSARAGETDRHTTAEARTHAALRREDAATPQASEAKALSKDFAKAKPVQVYWFFGGR
jgi:hypothetical protein